MKKRAPAVIISMILSLFSAVVIFAICIVALLKCTLLDENTVYRSLNNTDYTTMLSDEIKGKWDNLASICGVEDREELLALVTPELVLSDTKEYFRQSYADETPTENTDLRNRVYEIVEQYAKEHDAHLISDEELEKNINDLVDYCMDDYNSAVKVRFMPTVISSLNRLNTLLVSAAIACAVVLVLFAVFTFFLQVRRRDTLYYMSISLLTNAVVFWAAHLVVMRNGYIERIPVAKTALYYLVTDYLRYCLAIIKNIAVILSVSAVVLIAIYISIGIVSYFRNKRALASDKGITE